MVLKKFFGGSKKEATAEQQYTIEDLFVLERYEEAETRLKDRLRVNPNDLHAHLRLADVYIQMRQLAKAVDEYVFVAEEYSDDGFHDKAIALLSKVAKLVPMDETLPSKIEKLHRRKKLEVMREQALEGLREGMGHTQQGGTSALELQGMWGKLVGSAVVQHLDGQQLKRLFSAMNLHRFETGEALAERNSDHQELFLIVRGTVEATASTGGGKPTQLRTFGSGDAIGEMAALEKKAWPATYVATEPTTVLRLTRTGLERALIGSDDPRAIIEALRVQQNDRAVALAIQQLSR